MKEFLLGEDHLTIEAFVAIINDQLTPSISESAWKRVRQYRSIIDKTLASTESVYGINTGFGFLSDVSIPEEDLETLQVNLVRSHACGVGPSVPDRVVKALLILRLHTFCLGHTGISEDCVRHIQSFLQFRIFPVVPSKGSVGASGDLAPLAHLALGFIGEGDVSVDGVVKEASQALEELKLKPYGLKAKEGLSLINGTHFMTAIAAMVAEAASNLMTCSDIILALSLDAIRGTTRAFDDRIHRIRPQSGQLEVAQNIRLLFEEKDEIQNSHKDCGKVQDPYSFRCAPQVHGASRDALRFVKGTLETELNSVTDNPLVFEDGETISGGNFHGQPVSLAMDFLAIALAEIGSMSERRIEKLTNPNMSGLPPFVARESGVNSGFMIPHVVAAALVSENKVLCHPASVDSIPTSADKEDHVSMGPIAPRKCESVLENVTDILAIELLTACQGIDLMQPLKPNKTLSAVYNKVRSVSPSMESDRSLHKDIKAVAKLVASGELRVIIDELGVKLS